MAKLVRDRIPEIIERKGDTYKTHVADEQEYFQSLADKLVEEAREYATNPSTEELADVLEVVSALREFHPDVDAVQEKKAVERGRFSKRYILE